MTFISAKTDYTVCCQSKISGRAFLQCSLIRILTLVSFQIDQIILSEYVFSSVSYTIQAFMSRANHFLIFRV
jgi:hypothetical protein